MKFKITGFSHSKGNAKATGKPYNMAKLQRLVEIRPWKNENGEGRAAGYHTDERTGFDVYSEDVQLVNKLLMASYPCTMELTFEPHPDDPTRNIVTNFEIVDPIDEI